MSWLHTEGSEIKDSSGRIIRLVGVNVMLTDKGEPPGPWDSDASGRIHREQPYITISNAGANCVRLCVGLRLLSDEPVPWGVEYSKESTLATIDKIVETCRKHGLYVHIALMFNTYNTSGLGDYTDWMQNKQEKLKQITLDLATRYGNEPTMMGINLINEPFDPSNGSNSEYWWSLYRNYCVDLAYRLHQINPKLLVFLDSMPNSTHPERWIDTGFLNEPNCVYTWHRYLHLAKGWNGGNWAEQYEAGDLVRAKQLLEQETVSIFLRVKYDYDKPMILGEFGTLPSDANRLVFVKDFMNIMEKHGIGCLIWAMQPEDYSELGILTSDLSTFNDYGQTWKENIGWKTTPISPLGWILPIGLPIGVGLGFIYLTGSRSKRRG